jgi:3-phosphoshikimate 1-carboxyvinyltransferase
MEKIIHPISKPIQTTTTIPGSKSISNRALLLSALAQGTSNLQGLQISDDILSLIDALKKLGVQISLDEKNQSAVVKGCKGQFPNRQSIINCNESGTLARLLIPLCAAMPGCYAFKAAPSLQKRSIKSLVDVLIQQNIQLQPVTETLPFKIISSKGLSGGEIKVDGSQTGQTVSGLLMSASFMASPLKLTVKNLVSRSYVTMTCQMMEEFGVKVKNEDDYYYIRQPQHYHAQEKYNIEPDWSTASYFFAAAAVTAGEITVPNITRAATKQGDAIFLSILEKMGCQVIENKLGITVKRNTELQGLTVNMQDCPDVFITLATIAPFAKTPTTITGIGHARNKESDRLTAVSINLKRLGIQVQEQVDGLKIFPGVPQFGKVSSYRDHRIAMAFAIIGLKTGIIIEDAECVAKSCPQFFELWEKMMAG